MTSFGIKPPTLSILGLGAIKTDDNVKITVSWLVAQPEKAAESK